MEDLKIHIFNPKLENGDDFGGVNKKIEDLTKKIGIDDSRAFDSNEDNLYSFAEELDSLSKLIKTRADILKSAHDQIIGSKNKKE